MKWKRHLFLIIGVLFSFVNAQSPTFSVDMEASSQAIQPTLANVGSGAEFTIAIRGSNLTHVRTYDCSVQFDPAKFDYVSGSALEGYAGAGEQNLLKANGASTTFPQVEIQGASNNIVVFTNTILGQPDLEASGGGLLCIMSFKSKLIDGESGDFQIIQGRTIDKSLNETVITSFANGICSASDIYTVTISANANGSVNPSGEVFVIEGDNLNVEATANANYHFLQWEVTGSIVATDPDKTGQFTVNGNGTIAATFEADPVPGMSVDMNSALAGIQPEIVGKGTGDTVVIEIRGHDLSDVRSYECNVKFDHTKFEYVAGSAQEGNPATPEQNIFKANGATTTNFLISTPGEDNIEIANTIMSQPALMVDGNGLLAVVKFKSLLNEGGSGTFEIEEGKTVDTDLNETSITLLNDGTYHCPYTVTFIAGSNGSITGTLIQKVRLGGNCTAVTAVPGTGYHFTGWTGGYTGTTNPITVTNVTSNMTITADFAINTYTVTFVAGSNGTITGTLSQNVAHGGNCTAVTAAPGTGYHFTGWTGGYTGTTNPITVTNVTSNMTITADFTINTYTVTFVAGSNGAITGTLSQNVAHGGNCTAVTAAPGTGYHFTGWTGGYTGTTNPLTVTNVTSNMTITADFAINTYTVTFVAGSNGTITGTLSQNVAHGGNCTAVTAVPGTGYHFTGWTGGYTSTTNPLTVTNVTSNITITADFAINTYTVTFVAGSNGTITGTLSQNVAHGGNCTEVTAVPSTGYKFTGWTGGNTGTTNPLTVTNVTSNMTVTANFDLDVPITNNVTVNNNKIDFIVGPNPAKSSDIIKFQISGPVIGDAIVIIFDAVGNVVFKNEYSLNNPNGRPLVFGSWSLVNKRIGSGAYCAILKITDRNGDITNAKKLIGIKE